NRRLASRGPGGDGGEAIAAVSLPATPSSITPEWLTAVLRESGAIYAARITEVAAATLGAGSGFTGEVARLSVHYDRADPRLPASMIVKMPGSHPETRRLTDAFAVYP